MNVFVFASQNLTNIWAGMGAGLWAVSPRSEKGMRELETKAKGMSVGSLGLLYWSAGKAFTTPFVVGSEADPTRTVTGIWPEAWVMGFKIIPLGNPKKQFERNRAVEELKVFEERGTTNLGHVFRLAPTQVFVPTVLPDEDWAILFAFLAD